MTRVWRKRRALKWVGLSLSILMLGLWVFSVLFVSSYVAPSGQAGIGIQHGRIGISDVQGMIPGWTFRLSYPEWKVAQLSWTYFAQAYLGFALPNKIVGVNPNPGKIGGGVLQIPIWMLVVAAGFPTAILWWRDRRPKAGFCKVCKYDLTGNVSGTCPECGTAVGPETG